VSRPAESDKVRRWNGVVAHANELDEFQVWVVWGLAPPPEHAADPDLYPPGARATDIAVQMACDADPEFAAADDDHRWVMLVEGDEDDIDEWVNDNRPLASGFTAYLLEAARAAGDPAMPPRPLDGG
jgi:hypothetical protein